MLTSHAGLRRTALAAAVGASLVLVGIGSTAASTSTTDPAARQARAAPVPGLLEPTDQSWAPEALEDLLAPVALYPDDFIGHVLVATTNPQEVLDAGSWRLKNQNLTPQALDAAAARAGFTAPTRVILQNPIVLDMLCTEFGWTQELGQAYVNDQAGVLDAIQRLRHQARDAGNLESSDQMLVETATEGGHEAILLSSPDPNVVSVPQYDVERVYAAVDDDDDDGGVSTGTAIITSLLSFGGGMALGALFDDDDDDDWDDNEYYHPVYYGAPMPYYSHYAYRPVYPGYYPATVYAPPPAYPYAYGNTTVVHRNVNNYWNRYDDRAYVRGTRRATVSPITKARPNRPELRRLNETARRGPARRAPVVAEERGEYVNRKHESATRAETRKVARAERRSPGLDRVNKPTVKPVKPVDGTRVERSGKPTVDRAGAPTRGRATAPTRKRTGTRAGTRAGVQPDAATRDRTGARRAQPAPRRDRTTKAGAAERAPAPAERVAPETTGGVVDKGPAKAGRRADRSQPKTGRSADGAGRGKSGTGGGRRRGAAQGRTKAGAKAAPAPRTAPQQ
jgi:hypothetical protein